MKGKTHKNLSKEFVDYMIRSSLPGMKRGLIFTCVLFFGFVFINEIFFRDFPEQKYFMRFGLILPFILLSLIFFYVKSFWKNLDLLLTLVNTGVAVTVFFVGAFADFSIQGYSYFYAWTMLVFLGTAAFYRLRMTNFIIVGSLLLAAYISASLINKSYLNAPLLFTNNLFFIVATASISYFIVWNLFQLNRRNFLHHKALEKNYRELLLEIRERNKIAGDLIQTENQKTEILNIIPDSIFVINKDLNIVMANEKMIRVNSAMGLETDVHGKKFFEVFPFLPKETVQETVDVFTRGENLITTQKLRVAGNDFHTETRKIPIIKNNEVIQVMAIIRDVSKEKAYDDLKVKNAEQKELLLREIHHRVKNNLAIVISMLSLQTRSNPDPVLGSIIQDIEMRIRSMALIHEHLYRSENLDRIPLAEYLKSLSTIIGSTFQRKNVVFQSELEPMDANIEAALPIGLITNELLTNAFKYAFAEEGQGTIKLSLSRVDEDGFMLEISDNGRGLPEDFSFEDQTTLGMFMVKLLVEQLYGHLEIINKNGTTFRIMIPHKLM
jgi:PAS domain S-box-containing protein